MAGCSFSRPKPAHGPNITYTQQNNIRDMCLVTHGNKQVLVTSSGIHGIKVYNVDTDEIEWKKKYGLRESALDLLEKMVIKIHGNPCCHLL